MKNLQKELDDKLIKSLNSPLSVFSITNYDCIFEISKVLKINFIGTDVIHIITKSEFHIKNEIDKGNRIKEYYFNYLELDHIELVILYY